MYFEDEYGGYYEEPSIADEIIDRAVNEIRDYIVDTAKSALSEYKKAESEKDAIQDEIHKAQYELYRTREDIERAKNELIKEKRDMPSKYIREFVREATGNLAPGDKVYVLKGQYETCAFCKGTGTVFASISGLGENVKVNCPKCNGSMGRYRARATVEEDEVKEVRLKLCFEKNRANYWSTDCVYLCRNGQADYATPAKNIFLTREEAEAALAKEG